MFAPRRGQNQTTRNRTAGVGPFHLPGPAILGFTLFLTAAMCNQHMMSLEQSRTALDTRARHAWGHMGLINGSVFFWSFKGKSKGQPPIWVFPKKKHARRSFREVAFFPRLQVPCWFPFKTHKQRVP